MINRHGFLILLLISVIVAGVKKMYRLLQDLLEYSTLINAQNKPQYSIDLNLMLADVKKSINGTLEPRNVEWKIPSLPTITANPERMIQLFRELFGKAIRYNKADPVIIEVGHQRLTDHHLFHVRDNGLGISEEYHDRIFEAFQRLWKDEFPGTGIGLAICQKIVERHNGKIWVESQEGKGSTFYFSFPCNN